MKAGGLARRPARDHHGHVDFEGNKGTALTTRGRRWRLGRRACAALALLATGPAAGEAPLEPIPPATNLAPAKVALGERLFHDPRLSADGSTSCASCHRLSAGGDDDHPRSVGVAGRQGSLNAPTVFNARFNVDQNWDGSAPDLEGQIDGPIHDHREMATDWPEVVATLEGLADYRGDFESLYADGVTAANVRDAIAEFERSLVTVDAPFDRYLRGEPDALDPRQQAGYRHFVDYGCVACHNGRNVGGNMYATMGVMGDFFADHDKQGKAHLGRFRVTGDPADRHLFRVPSLRLAVDTAPYLHDGSIDELEEVIQVMAEYQLGRRIPAEDVALIAEFIGSLRGEYRPYPTD